VLKCEDCDGIPYRVFRRQNQLADGTLLPSYETVLWPNGSGVLPPLHNEHITCPECHCALKRVAP